MSAALRFYGRTVDGRNGDRPWPHPIVSAIRDRADFHAGAMRGQHVNPGAYVAATPGRLEGADLDAWRHDLSHGLVTYVVVSYSTPIAWHVAAHARGLERWVVPQTSYSVTSTRHQGYVARAVLS